MIRKRSFSISFLALMLVSGASVLVARHEAKKHRPSKILSTSHAIAAPVKVESDSKRMEQSMYTLDQMYAARSLFWTKWAAIGTLSIGIPTLIAAIIAAWPVIKRWIRPRLSQTEKDVLLCSINSHGGPCFLTYDPLHVGLNAIMDSQICGNGCVLVTSEVISLQEKGLIVFRGAAKSAMSQYIYESTINGYNIAKELHNITKNKTQ